MRKDDINGAVIGTEGAWVKVETVSITLTFNEVQALCGLIYYDVKSKGQGGCGCIDTSQRKIMKLIGEDLAILVDHPMRVKKLVDTTEPKEI